MVGDSTQPVSIDTPNCKGASCRMTNSQVSKVTHEGFYSVMGGIIRIHPLGRKKPIKLDCFGDTIEAIKRDEKSGSHSSIFTSSLYNT